MRIVFLGCTQFSYEIASFLLKNGFKICGIVTTPKKIRISYSKNLVNLYTFADLKHLARENRVPLVEVSQKFGESYSRIKKLEPDLLVAVGWYFMVPKKIRELAKKGCIGIHVSMLPRYAGGAPVVWAMINGEKKLGVTLFYFSNGVDTGDIIAQRELPIYYKDDISSVYNRATDVSKNILLEFLPQIEKGTAPRIKQDLSKRTVYPQRNPKDGKIDWTKSAEEIRNFVRAQTRPYPGAYSFLEERKIRLWKAEIKDYRCADNKKPGEIIAVKNDTFVIATGKGLLLINDYEPKGLIQYHGQVLL